MPEPSDAAAITHGRESGRHSAEALVEWTTPISHAGRTAGIIWFSQSVPLPAQPGTAKPDAPPHAPTRRGVACAIRSPPGCVSSTPLALWCHSPARSIAAVAA